MDEEALLSAIKTIIATFDNPNREGVIDTPERVAKAYFELLKANEPKITVFNSEGYSEMIFDRKIQYYTFCEHHMLPFFGEVTIAYLPKDKIIGLSKLARIVEYFSRRLNTQEYFTENIANYLDKILEPNGVAVKVSGRHLCKEMRGVKKQGEMITFSYKGIFKEDLGRKQEFLKLC